MGSLLRKGDERCSDIVSDFLNDKFYSKKCKFFERINDKERQIQGIDVIFELNGQKYVCDEKAAIRYVNKNLKTFSLELSFINRSGDLHQGWLIDENKINDSFLLVWIDKAKQNIISSQDDIEELEFTLIKKESIIEYLNSIGWDVTKLMKKSELMRNNEMEYGGSLYEDGCKFVCSRFLYEKPVNVLLSRDILKKISVYNEKIIIK